MIRMESTSGRVITFDDDGMLAITDNIDDNEDKSERLSALLDKATAKKLAIAILKWVNT